MQFYFTNIVSKHYTKNGFQENMQLQYHWFFFLNALYNIDYKNPNLKDIFLYSTLQNVPITPRALASQSLIKTLGVGSNGS